MDATYTSLETQRIDDDAKRADLRGECYSALFNEFTEAFNTDPCQAIRTPGYATESRSLADLFAEELADDILAELMLMLRDIARGDDCQLRACLLRDRIAKRHAEYHCDDLAAQIEDQE